MITFRALEIEDLDLLYQIENEQTAWSNGSTHAPYSRHSLSQYIATTINDFYTERQLRLVAEDGGQAIGLVDLFDYNPQHERAEVGIAIIPESRGQGRATQCLKELTNYALQHLHLHQLYAYVSDKNNAAKQAFTSAGYNETARLRDWISVHDGAYTDAVVYQLLL